MEGKFIVGDKEIIFNNDAKIFCEAWLTYCFGKELIRYQEIV